MLLQCFQLVLFFMMSSILWRVPVPLAAKHAHMMMLSQYFTAGMRIFGFYTDCTDIWMLDSSVYRTCLHNEGLCPWACFESIFWRSFTVVLILHKNMLISGTQKGFRPEQYNCWTFPWCLCLHITIGAEKCGTFGHLEVLSRMEIHNSLLFPLICPLCQTRSNVFEVLN